MKPTTKKQLISIGALLLLFGVIGSNPNILGGIAGWVFMVIGVVVMIIGVTKKAK